jgi:hypothetical protein
MLMAFAASGSRRQQKVTARVGDDVRRAQAIRTAFVQRRVGRSARQLVRTPASANDVHGEGTPMRWERHSERLLVLESATVECPYSKAQKGAVAYSPL